MAASGQVPLFSQGSSRRGSVSPLVVKGSLVCTPLRALVHLSNGHHHGSGLTGSLARDALAQDDSSGLSPYRDQLVWVNPEYHEKKFGHLIRDESLVLFSFPKRPVTPTFWNHHFRVIFQLEQGVSFTSPLHSLPLPPGAPSSHPVTTTQS